MHLFLFDILSFLGYWNIYCHLYMFFAALFASTCNSAKEVSHWKISQIVQFVWQDQDIYLKFMKLGMGQWAMCWCRVPIFSTVWIWERGGVVLQHCWWGKAGVNCVRIERKRGGSPQGTASLASQRKIPLAGQASHTLSFFVTTGIVSSHHITRSHRPW